MKKFVIKSLSLLMVLLTLISILPMNSYGSSVRYYQTKQDNVILRTGPASSYKDNTKTVQYKGTVLRVVSQATNSSGNLWYKLDNGYWVFSDRVKAHSHSYYGGICTGRNCGYVYPLTVTSFSATVVVTNGSGAKGWSRPYSENSTHIKTYAYGTVLKIVAKTTNIDSKGNAHNLWLKLEDGNWVYSDNVTRRYTVSYNENGGSGAPSNQYFLSGSTLTLSSTKPSRVGYTFKGWSTSSSSSTVSYTPGDKYSTKKSITLYAVWAKCSHTYKGGICTKCKYEYPLSITNYSGSFKFVVTNSDGAKGWSRPYSSNSTKNKTYTKGTVLDIVAKTTNIGADGKPDNLWYKVSDGNWVYSGNVTQQFTVKYNANGGKSAPSSQTFLSGKSITISSTKPSRVGYTFKGWSTSSSSSTVSYTPGDKYSTKKSITLYAVWAKCSHTYNGGICTKCKYEYPLKETSYSAVFVVTNDNGAPVWSRPYSSNSKNLRFEDYNTKLQVVAKTTNIGTDGKYDNVWYKLSDGNWVYSGNVAQQLTVKYNANGGKGAPSSQTFLSGKTLTLSKTKPTKEGYVFKGWATTKDATKATYSAGGKYSEKKNVTLYAVWAKCSHSYNDKGICTKCKYDYNEKVDKSVAGTYVVIESKAYIRDIPYEVGSVVKTVNKNRILKVVGKTTNAKNKVWYKLEDGSWIFSDRVKPGFMASYNLNGGEGENFSSGFVTGELVVTSKIPTRAGYAFMGWATSSKATKATYKTGDTYSVKKNIKLYAVWSKCTTHDYDNNYGICKNCKSEYPLTVTNMTNTVYSVNNSNGTSTYKRAYSKSSEKVKKLSKGSLVLVVGKAQNANGATWYKLKDGSWIKASDVKKQYTYNEIYSIPASCFTTLQKGSVDAKQITGVWYYAFTYNKNTIYVSVSAFEGQSKNTQLDQVNTAMMTAVNKDNRLPLKDKKFIYNKKSSTSKTLFGKNGKPVQATASVWTLNLLTASAGIDTSEILYVSCTNKASAVQFTFCSKVALPDDLSIEPKAPSTASEYVRCLTRTTPKANIYPKFTVSVAPKVSNGYLAGYFTNCEITGKGYAKNTLALEGYVELSSCVVNVGSSIASVYAKPTPMSVYRLIMSGWSLVSKVSSYTESADYTTPSQPDTRNLSYYDDDNSKEYYAYSMSLTSPIRLQSADDYLKVTIKTNELKRDQDITVKLEIK